MQADPCQAPLPPTWLSRPHYGTFLTPQLVAFFDHWAWRHDYNNAVVCVRTGGTVTKAAKDWTKRQVGGGVRARGNGKV